MQCCKCLQPTKQQKQSEEIVKEINTLKRRHVQCTLSMSIVQGKTFGQNIENVFAIVTPVKKDAQISQDYRAPGLSVGREGW